mgnify:CR=1 FL=1
MVGKGLHGFVLHFAFVVLAMLAWATAPGTAHATDGLASLIADKIETTPQGALIATGNVEVIYQTTRLRATHIAFDPATDQLDITGPLQLVEGSDIILLADQAQLSRDLQIGILRSARLVLNQQLQMAAQQITRSDGRYSELSRAIASSCQVCAASPTPLWEIRARRIVHDQQSHQIYFDNAQFRIAGVPVFYMPRLRMPDPTLKRASGFLMPSLRSSSTFGTGFALPYFWKIGKSRDLTLTPFISNTRAASLGLRYRQALRNDGKLEFEAALTRDSLGDDQPRGYFYGNGTIGLPADYTLSFGIETVSDTSYLLDYSLDQKNRLRSFADLSRFQRDRAISVWVIGTQSNLATENGSILPGRESGMIYQHRLTALGGVMDTEFQAASLYRRSNTDVEGRDTTTLSARLGYTADRHLGGGLLGQIQAQIRADFSDISQDSAYPSALESMTPIGAVSLRWPWVKSGAQGTRQVVSPMLQLVHSNDTGTDGPNDHSALVDFDEGNLFSLNRFPGADGVERGTRANLGLSWLQTNREGDEIGLVIGRVLRARNLGQFNASTGLDGLSSDWLVVARVAQSGGLALTERAVFDDALDFARNELRLAYDTTKWAVSSSHLYLEPDSAEDRPNLTSEWALDARYQLDSTWSAATAWRVDLERGTATEGTFGLQYTNSCVALDLSLSRRFTSSTTVEPTTKLGLTVELIGFGGSSGRAARASECRG